MERIPHVKKLSVLQLLLLIVAHIYNKYGNVDNIKDSQNGVKLNVTVNVNNNVAGLCYPDEGEQYKRCLGKQGHNESNTTFDFYRHFGSFVEGSQENVSQVIVSNKAARPEYVEYSPNSFADLLYAGIHGGLSR